ncbi:hypothetical protein TruAng_008658 [Truncatella angustata]|nr:hypothetical protein TruAng_008658 [Truncatella angustata]
MGLVASQSGLPQCARDCLAKFTSGASIGGCAQIDAKCICSQQAFLNDIACCLASVCSQSDQQAAVDYAVNLCAAQGVTVPSAVSCSSTSAGASTAITSSSGSSTIGAASNTAVTTAITSSTASAAGSSTTTTASQNIGKQGNGGSGTSGIIGGLLAVLALF